MILIKANDNTADYANPVILTLFEKQTLTDPTFLFQFTNDSTGEAKVFTAPDISTANQRFNRFEIQALRPTQTEDLYNGKVKLPLLGYYSYTIYETVTTSPIDLDVTHATGIVETGKVLVHSLEREALPATFTVDEDKDNFVFDPD